MNDEHSKTGDPAVGSTRLLADAYRQVTELWDRLNDAQWSRGMTRKDHQQVADFQTKLHNLLNTLYRATQANAAGEPQPRKPRT